MFKRNLATAVLAPLLLASAACGGGGGGSSTSEKLIVQTGNPAANISNIGIYVADAKGYFKDQGLDVELRYSQGAPLATQLAVSGQADIASISFEPIIDGHSKGLTGTFFYAKYRRGIYSIKVLDDSPITSIDQLAGKKVGVASLTSSAVPFTKINLGHAGADPDSVTFQPVGVGGPAGSALTSGKVDALALWTDPYATLAQGGLDLRTVDSGGVGRPGGGGYFASTRTLDDRADDLGKFGRAITEALAFVENQPEEAIKIYWEVNSSARSAGMDAALASLKAVLEDFRTQAPYGEFDTAAVQTYIDQYAEVQGIDDPPSVKDIVSNEFVDAANDQAGSK